MNLKLTSKPYLKTDLRIPFLPMPKAWTGLALNGQIVTGFDLAEDSPFLEQSLASKEATTTAYFEAVGNLSFLQKLFVVSSTVFADFFQTELALQKISNGRSLAELQSLALMVRNLPEVFLFWAHEKNLHFFDLAALLSLSPDQASGFGPLLRSWSEVQFSKSQGAQSLELLVELFLIRNSKNAFTSDLQSQITGSAEQTLKNLKTLRYPETSNKDAESKTNSLPWPGIVQAQGQRQGDRWGYRLNFFVSNPQELTKTVDQLQKAAEQWKNQN